MTEFNALAYKILSKLQNHIATNTSPNDPLIQVAIISNNPTENGRLRSESRLHEYAKNNNRVLIILAIIDLNPYINSRRNERESGTSNLTILHYLKVEFPGLSESI